ncbi:MAG: hypothetical protein JWM32_122 [Verrucomicrobia bacterium]|nr:hypothetical protein [Verrucomicrobiota bacterium]
MVRPGQLLRKIRTALRREKFDRGLSAEIKAHVELQAEFNVARGMTPREAHFQALRQFGHVEGAKEEVRATVGLPWIEQFAQDFRYGLRQLAKAPGFATIAILTVAIGIGACTSLFSVVNVMVIKPLSYDHPERMVRIMGTWLPKFPVFAQSPASFEMIRRNAVFEDVAAVYGEPRHLIEGEIDTVVYPNNVTTSLFSIYNMTVDAGRLFLPEEQKPGGNPVVIITRLVWQKKYGGRADIIGRQIQLDDKLYTIIGVVFDRQWPDNQNYFLPAPLASHTEDVKSQMLFVIGRLKAGATVEAAQREVDVLARQLAEQSPATNKNHGIKVTRELDFLTTGYRTQLFVLLGAVVFLLLIACVNVASLLLARANARQREIAVRTALGAGRGRIIRQFLCESLLISTFGGLLGIMFAYASIGPLARFASHFMPRTERIAVDGTVLGVTCALMVLCGLGFGLFPALQSTRGDMINSLKDGSQSSSAGRQRRRVQNTLVVVEVALAVILLSCSGLLIRSLHSMQSFDQGLKTENVYGTNFGLNSKKKYGTPERIIAFTREALQRVQALPGIECAAFTSAIPMGNRENGVRPAGIQLEGNPVPTSLADRMTADYYAVTPDYFKVMSIVLVRGRTFTAQDVTGASPVMLINREMARKLYPDQDPIGKKVRVLRNGKAPEDNAWNEIIGIVGDVKPRGPMSPTNPQVYLPFEQSPQSEVTLMLRTTETEAAMGAKVRAVLRSIDQDNPVETIYAYWATIAYSWVTQRFSMILFSLFSALALVLAAIGIYGVMAYAVNQRRQEIGIRIALGALPADVFRLVLGNGARIVGLGLLLGTAGALACARLLQSLLFNTSPSDPLTFVSIIALLACVGFLACWVPARRATKVDPLIVLRHD